MLKFYWLAIAGLSVTLSACGSRGTEIATPKPEVPSPEAIQLRLAAEDAWAELDKDNVQSVLQSTERWLQTPYARLHPDAPEVLELVYVHARANFASKNDASANSDLDRILDPKNAVPALRNLIAEVRCTKGARMIPDDSEKGVVLALQALELTEQHTEAGAFARARCEKLIGARLYLSGRISQAKPHFETVLRLVEPVNAAKRRLAVVTLLFLAETANGAHDYAEAEKHLERAASLMELDAASNPEWCLDCMLRLYRARLRLDNAHPDRSLISRILHHFEKFPAMSLGKVPGGDTLIDMASRVDTEKLDPRILELVKFRVIRRQFPVDATVATRAPSTNESQGDEVENAKRVVGGLRGDSRDCYNKALAESPDEHGTIQLKLRVAADGTVSEVTGISVGLGESTGNCIVNVAGSRRFLPPRDGTAVIRVPVTFVKR